MTLPLPRPVFDAPVFDGNASGGGFGKLPEWDLTDLYPAPDAPAFARDMAWLETACADFAAAALRLVVIDAEDAALQGLMQGQARRLHSLDAQPRIEVRDDRGMAHPAHFLAQDSQPALPLDGEIETRRLVESVAPEQ